jgi:hypothetical protein
MQTRGEELRDELISILGAGRELSPETDGQLADAFMRFLEGQERGGGERAGGLSHPHQPHYSLQMSGAAWGAVLTLLFILLTVGNPPPLPYIIVCVVLLSLTAVLTRTFLYLARHGWRAPRVEVSVRPPDEAAGRG